MTYEASPDCVSYLVPFVSWHQVLEEIHPPPFLVVVEV